MKPYILAIDQSTQGTKGVVFDGEGTLLARADRPHARRSTPTAGWNTIPGKYCKTPWRWPAPPWKKPGWTRRTLAAVGISNPAGNGAGLG